MVILQAGVYNQVSDGAARRVESDVWAPRHSVDEAEKFMDRMWRSEETFHEYAHPKIILANLVPIDREELVECVIEGIPDANLRDQVRMQRLSTMESLLKAMSKVRLHQPRGTSMAATTATVARSNKVNNKNQGRSDSGEKWEDSERCVNCGNRGHKAAECPDKDKGRKCFKCGKFGHMARKCDSEVKSVHCMSVMSDRMKYVKRVCVREREKSIL